MKPPLPSLPVFSQQTGGQPDNGSSQCSSTISAAGSTLLRKNNYNCRFGSFPDSPVFKKIVFYGYLRLTINFAVIISDINKFPFFF